MALPGIAVVAPSLLLITKSVWTLTGTMPLNSDVLPFGALEQVSLVKQVAVAVREVPAVTPLGSGSVNSNRLVVSVPCAKPLIVAEYVPLVASASMAVQVLETVAQPSVPVSR